jgi:predicted enzyme related to lactoylglutathione lyase/quinol monooxygenase YgiN
MHVTPAEALHLTSEWFIAPGQDQAVAAVLPALVAQVQEQEPDTLAYLVHTPWPPAPDLVPLPPGRPHTLLFFEIYRDKAAFHRHVQGPVFTAFVREHGRLFVAANGAPFTFVSFLRLAHGFIRDTALAPAADNRHPAVMFEVLAHDRQTLLDFYGRVFGWHYEQDAEGFAYIRFPAEERALLGGIGQADATDPAYQAGRNFYLQVDDLERTIAMVVAAGGSLWVAPTSVDGYEFAMVKDPEDNIVGLVRHF